MQNNTRTVIGGYLQTAQLLGLPVIIPPNSTLNEKLSISQANQIATTDVPKLGYVCIGNGGHSVEIGINNIPINKPVQFHSTSTALYNQLPFVMRLETNDMTPAERANYRLRKVEVHGGVPYIAYYGRVLDLANVVPATNYNTVANGVTTITPFVPSVANMNPTPPATTAAGVVIASGDYVSATAKVPFIMSPADIVEFTNVANIIYGNPNYAIISEIALCSGVDKQVSGTFNAVTGTYTESIGVQVMSFSNAYYQMQFNNNGINMMLELGASEPLSVAL